MRHRQPGRFAAIDFETANSCRDSACAVGVAVVAGGRIVERIYELIRPPSRTFEFTHIHGLSWTDVRAAPTFGELWPTLQARVGPVEFLAAHNAPFDRSVLSACCAPYALAPVPHGFVCTVKVARRSGTLIRPNRRMCVRVCALPWITPSPPPMRTPARAS